MAPFFYVHTPQKCLGRGDESIYCTLVPSILYILDQEPKALSLVCKESLSLYTSWVPAYSGDIEEISQLLFLPVRSQIVVCGIVWFIIIIYLFITYYCVSVCKEHCRFYRSPVFGQISTKSQMDFTLLPVSDFQSFLIGLNWGYNLFLTSPRIDVLRSQLRNNYSF